MTQPQMWHRAFYFLSTVFVLTAALNMLQLDAGILTNHAADIVVPAWLYVVLRGYAPGGSRGPLGRMFGRSPTVAALTLFGASACTEVSQRFWPHGLFPGTFDPLDIAAFATGLGACYVADRILMHRLATEAVKPTATPGIVVE